MIDRDKTLEKVLTFITNKFPDASEGLTGASKLTNTVLIDSLATLEIIMFIEREFELSLDRSELDSFDTPDNIVQLILDKQNTR